MTNERWPNRIKSPVGPVPYGYIQKEGDPASLVPDVELIAYIEEALKSLNAGASLRETAVWLSDNSGKKISHVTLAKIWKNLDGDQTERRAKLKEIATRKEPKTLSEKRLKKLAYKKAAEKRRITAATKRLQSLEEQTKPETVSEEPIQYTVYEDFVPDEEDNREVIFKANPGPQFEFLGAPEQEVLYGGAAGGGKSYAMLADPMRYFDNPNFNGLLIRRTNDELRELKWKSRELYQRVFPSAKWNTKDSEWTFPSGARLWMTYLERDEDVLRYQGQAFTWIGIDELTQYSTPFAWNYLRSRLRTGDSTLPTYMRATSNPGGPGHGWVKRMFIDPAPKNKPFWATDIETGKTLVEPDTYPQGHPLSGQPNPQAGKPLFKRRFISSSVFDNPYLANTAYVQSLYSLPEQQRRQLLEGDWSVSDGAAFQEFREHLHVMEPFQIPSDWRRFRSCDFGYGSHSAVHWFAIDPVDGTLYVYRELYVSKYNPEALADEILRIEREGGDRIAYGVLDSSCWHQRGQIGPSIAEAMNSRGCRWRPSDRSAGSRVAGRMRLHELLKVSPDTGRPGIIFFNTCRQIITDLPVIPTDPKGSDDIDDRYASDHTYDSIRYGIMSRPRPISLFDIANNQSNWHNPSDSTFGY